VSDRERDEQLLQYIAESIAFRTYTVVM